MMQLPRIPPRTRRRSRHFPSVSRWPLRAKTRGARCALLGARLWAARRRTATRSRVRLQRQRTIAKASCVIDAVPDALFHVVEMIAVRVRAIANTNPCIEHNDGGQRGLSAVARGLQRPAKTAGAQVREANVVRDLSHEGYGASFLQQQLNPRNRE